MAAAIDPERIDSASRLIRAEIASVYRALTDGAAVAAWLPPEGMRGVVHAFEPRPGGRIALTLTYERPDAGTHGKSSDDSDIVEGRFVDLVENERLVWDVDFVSDDPAFAGTMRMTWTLSQVGNATELGVAASNVPLGISPRDHAAGLGSTLDNLAAYVESASTRPDR